MNASRLLLSLHSLIRTFRLWRLSKAGLKISNTCRITSMPHIGEPYLVDLSGEHLLISDNVTFLTHDGATHVFRDLPKYRDVIRFAPIRVMDNCFIGINSTILPGVTIGPNAVVGAGSVVTKDVMPGTVVAGNPARFLCTVEEFAEKCLKENLPIDRSKYLADKRKTLQEFFSSAAARD